MKGKCCKSVEFFETAMDIGRENLPKSELINKAHRRMQLAYMELKNQLGYKVLKL